MTGPAGDWTAGELDIVRAMLAKDQPASAIARALPGRSRSAVIGKINRLKGAIGRLVPRPGPRSTKTKVSDAPVKPRAARRKVDVPIAADAFAVGQPAVVALAQPIAADHALVLPPTTFLDAINRDRCLYFAGDPMSPAAPDMPVCGAERAHNLRHTRYCRRHLAAQAQARAA